MEKEKYSQKLKSDLERERAKKDRSEKRILRLELRLKDVDKSYREYLKNKEYQERFRARQKGENPPEKNPKDELSDESFEAQKDDFEGEEVSEKTSNKNGSEKETSKDERSFLGGLITITDE